MYSEILQYKAKSKLLQFLQILGCALALIVFGTVCMALQSATGLMWFGLLTYAAAILLAWYFYSTFLRKFHYTIGDVRMKIARSYGRKPITLEEIPIKRIISFEPWLGKDRPKQFFALRSSKELILLKYRGNGKAISQLVFAPSDEFLSRLREVTGIK